MSSLYKKRIVSYSTSAKYKDLVWECAEYENMVLDISFRLLGGSFSKQVRYQILTLALLSLK